MFSRSFLTTIIGFLTGCILYLITEPYTTYIFLFGGLGYVIGLILDNSDRKKQIETFHFSSIPTTHEIFYSQEIPEAVVIYSAHENTTSVLLDYRIEAKPEDYRLSVLKNLQEFDFRIIEDSSQTIFSLCIEYPEFNYPSIKETDHKKVGFYYNIKERSNDFQSAIQKLIPGIVICVVHNPDIFGNKTISGNNSLSPPTSFHFNSSPPFNSGNMPFDKETEREMKSEKSKPDDSDEQVNENQDVNSPLVDLDIIMEDLNQDPVPKKDLEEMSSKKSSLLTAKQIEEYQNNILTHDETEEPQTEEKSKSIQTETDKISSQGLFDYSSVDNSSSMPMDAAGQGILLRLENNIKEQEVKQTRNLEKNLE